MLDLITKKLGPRMFLGEPLLAVFLLGLVAPKAAALGPSDGMNICAYEGTIGTRLSRCCVARKPNASEEDAWIYIQRPSFILGFSRSTYWLDGVLGTHRSRAKSAEDIVWYVEEDDPTNVTLVQFGAYATSSTEEDVIGFGVGTLDYGWTVFAVGDANPTLEPDTTPVALVENKS